MFGNFTAHLLRLLMLFSQFQTLVLLQYLEMDTQSPTEKKEERKKLKKGKKKRLIHNIYLKSDLTWYTVIYE